MKESLVETMSIAETDEASLFRIRATKQLVKEVSMETHVAAMRAELLAARLETYALQLAEREARSTRSTDDDNQQEKISTRRYGWDDDNDTRVVPVSGPSPSSRLRTPTAKPPFRFPPSTDHLSRHVM